MRPVATTTGPTLDHVHGQPEAVGALRQIVRDLEAWRAGKIRWAEVTRSFLLYGPPGTGKTLLAHALAGSTPAPEDDWSQLTSDLEDAGVHQKKLISITVLANAARKASLSPAQVSRIWLQSTFDTAGQYEALKDARALIHQYRASITTPTSPDFAIPVRKSAMHCVRLDLPPRFADEVASWREKFIRGLRKGHRGKKRKSAHSPKRADQVLRGVTYVYTAMVTAGLLDPGRNTSVSDMLDPDALDELIQWELNGDFPWRKLETTTLFEYLNNWKLFVRGCGHSAEALAEARKTNTPNRRRTYFQRSGVLALLSLVPLRISDVNAIIMGEHLKRSESGWSLTISSQKTGYRHNGPLHHSLTPYLDDLLLYGEGGPVLPRYAQRMGIPLFATETNEHLSSRTLALSFKVATGGHHTPHIVRTLVHDALAKFGAYGAQLARILCGQTSPETAKSYEINAGRIRVEKGQEILSQIQKSTLLGTGNETRSSRARSAENYPTRKPKQNTTRQIEPEFPARSSAASTSPRYPYGPRTWSKPQRHGRSGPDTGNHRGAD